MDTQTTSSPTLPDAPRVTPELPVVVEPQLPDAPVTTPTPAIFVEPQLPAPAPTKPGKPNEEINEEIIDVQWRVLPTPMQPKLPASAPEALLAPQSPERPAKATPAPTGFAFPSTNAKPSRMPAPVPMPGLGWMDGLFGALSSLVSALSLDWLFGPPSRRKPRYKPVTLVYYAVPTEVGKMAYTTLQQEQVRVQAAGFTEPTEGSMKEFLFNVPVYQTGMCERILEQLNVEWRKLR